MLGRSRLEHIRRVKVLLNKITGLQDKVKVLEDKNNILREHIYLYINKGGSLTPNNKNDNMNNCLK